MTDSEKRPSYAILVVDDDAINIKIIQSILEGAGYETHSAGSGRECIKNASKFKTDLVLMDINMPGLSGIDACKELKRIEKTREAIVIFVTANTDDLTLEEAFDAGGMDYVRKPINRIEMLARIKSALEHREAAKRLAEEKKFEAVLATAGGVCHELNQPLQYVMGSVQLLMMDLEEENPVYEQLEKVRKQVERMGLITRKLMEITRYRTMDYVNGKSIIDIEQSTGP
ncbi:MAG: response regulator [Desulfobacteraceae bacterium]|nr:response regulator [Desulfobacteraceae bacterium]